MGLPSTNAGPIRQPSSKRNAAATSSSRNPASPSCNATLPSRAASDRPAHSCSDSAAIAVLLTLLKKMAHPQVWRANPIAPTTKPQQPHPNITPGRHEGAPRTTPLYQPCPRLFLSSTSTDLQLLFTGQRETPLQSPLARTGPISLAVPPSIFPAAKIMRSDISSISRMLCGCRMLNPVACRSSAEFPGSCARYPGPDSPSVHREIRPGLVGKRLGQGQPRHCPDELAGRLVPPLAHVGFCIISPTRPATSGKPYRRPTTRRFPPRSRE